jgi:hypothetical protein
MGKPAQKPVTTRGRPVVRILKVGRLQPTIPLNTDEEAGGQS